MKKMKTSIFIKLNGLISIMLSILGFGAACGLSSCEDVTRTSAAEYGTPYATFKAKGNVTSEMTSNTIPNIRIVMGYDTTFTDESGNYQISNTDFPDDQTYLLEFKDVDGEINGEYHPLDTVVEFIDPEFSGGGTSLWDNGETEKEVNVKLKDKE